MRSNYDSTVGSVSDSITRIPIGFLRTVGSDRTRYRIHRSGEETKARRNQRSVYEKDRKVKYRKKIYRNIQASNDTYDRKKKMSKIEHTILLSVT